MPKSASVKTKENFQIQITRLSEDLISEISDALAIEEPLEIRLGFLENGKQVHKSISITMRTPGDDFALAAGFLFTEGILHNKDQIAAIKHCGKFPNNQNTVRIDLGADESVNLEKLARNFYTTSSCGVCGKTSLEALATGGKQLESFNSPKIRGEIIHTLSAKLRERQNVFEQTGGLHAAALFDASGNLIDVKEDVGRHNAVDKLIGAKFLSEEIPLADKILFLSGRASFELLQKAVMAQIPIVCAIGAPSSLAVEAAREFGITLLGFVRNGKFNIYSDFGRITVEN